MSFSSLIDLLRSRAAGESGKPAYRFLKNKQQSLPLSYRELDERARTIAGWLAGQTTEGDRVLLLYPPGLEFLAGFFGCLYARVTPAPLPLPTARTGFEKLEMVQADTQATLALTTSELASRQGAVQWLRLEASDTIDAGFASEWKEKAAAAGELAYLQYTSGSTSAPRGVMISHANVLRNLESIDAGFRHTRDSVAVTWLPHFHDMGLIYGLLGPLWGGFPCYFMSPATFVQRPLTWLRAITQFRATHSGGPNFAYDLCARRVGEEEKAGLDLSSWELAFNGAEPVHAETLERFANAFAGCGFRHTSFYPAYGLAEASLKVSGGTKRGAPVLFTADASALARNRVEVAAEDSCEARVLVGSGQAGLDTKVLIVDPETLEECPPGIVGEIWTAGPGVARGYWRRPDETAETFGAY
ncbi:MAG: fatty acyl-AMP ligase, partial [bacterium]|nr:fatty acyl-AMP ligase [bacterium]